MVEGKAELFRFRRAFFFSVRAKTCKASVGVGEEGFLCLTLNVKYYKVLYDAKRITCFLPHLGRSDPS